MIIVTAGHVDHGKTSLIQALTGMNADRLPEEQRRGMTIDLGYAFMDLGDDNRLAFIDVPGHEKFINNMLCGVSHARHALLVVACDDGVMPQTREHLQILSLMPLESLTIALTKCDRVTADRVSEVQIELGVWLAHAGMLQGVSRQEFIVSAHTGFGIAELKAHLQTLSESVQTTVDSAPFRMVFDRVFSVKGAGLVATGTVISGCVNKEDKLYVINTASGSRSGLNAGAHKQQVRVRGLHAQGRESNFARAGDRVALNLTGNDHDIERGDWLSSIAMPEPVSRFAVVLSGFMPKHWQSVHLHHGASHQLGRIALLSEAPLTTSSANRKEYLAELVLEQPLLPAAGDMLVVRDACGRETLGGARVLELEVPTRGKRTAERIEYLTELAACIQKANKTPLLALTVSCSRKAVSIAMQAWSLQLSEAELQQHLGCDNRGRSDSTGLVSRGDWLVSRTLFDGFKTEMMARIAAHHESNPDELGLGRARLLRVCHSGLPTALVNQAIYEHLAAGELVMTRGQLHLPRHAIALSADELPLWQTLEQMFIQSRTPLWTSDICEPLGLSAKQARALCYKLVQLGYICALLKDRYILSDTLQAGAAMILAHLEEHDAVSTSEFCAGMQMGRKAGIQLLEWFDRIGFTRRLYKANSRTLRDAELFEYLRPIKTPRQAQMPEPNHLSIAATAMSAHLSAHLSTNRAEGLSAGVSTGI
ncbi:selenocysteine-specific translation elongation factor [Shewanella submarina]|uniref:Selenocysteine-specific elongation factor n=1 Tax=Shewanella submarina TaxID=2016376 RepID=A0ABV7GF23_9GAMM|nr:selenocysteine-specific translation elongation factor [Shewanella submarina]MCL1035775.1 selenocysteine-specific translation elongation factor [Shewanella submarina]